MDKGVANKGNSFDNTRIAVNTIIIYARIMTVSLISFLITRYIIQSLGVSDYGLYSVVGGIVSMMSFFSIAMITTTQRYINVEMGKKENANVNKIFNVSLVLHIGFATLIYVIALTIGLWYINNYLNINSGKLSDAVFVFFVSTTASAIGILVVPFMALMTAFERFRQIAIIDFITACLKVPLVILLLLYTGNHLRFYATGICLITMISMLMYLSYCKLKFPDIVRWYLYKDKALYKEILYFNNYTAMGAFAYLSRSQGCIMIINYFFGTLVNGAYAVAAQIEMQISNFVSNIGNAANPQMTQSYSAGFFSRSFELVCKVTRFSALLMLILCFSLCIELSYLLTLWLKNVPEGSETFCQAILLSLFLRSIALGVDPLIQATGKVKWYQISQGILLVLGLPLSILAFILGANPVAIVYVFMFVDILRTFVMFLIVCRITPFKFWDYARAVYIPIVKCLVCLCIYYFLYKMFVDHTLINNFLSFVLTVIFSVIVCFGIGLSFSEREKVVMKAKTLFNLNKL